MTEYKKEFPFPVMFAPEVPLNCTAEWLAKKQVPQFHCAGERRVCSPHNTLPSTRECLSGPIGSYSAAQCTGSASNPVVDPTMTHLV